MSRGHISTRKPGERSTWDEDHQAGTCGRFKTAMYGTRGAAQNWEMEYSEMMTEAGFTQGSHSACVLYHKEKRVRTVVDGDSFTVLGAKADLDWFREVAQCRMEVKLKSRLQRGKPGDVRILNRIATVAKDGLEYEADQRHAEILMKDLGADEGAGGLAPREVAAK